MKVVYLNVDSVVKPIEEGLVLALGYFDGLHLAHQQLIEETIQTAKTKGAKSGIMTFDPSPKQVLGKKKDAYYLTPHNKKIDLLNGLDLDFIFVINFNEQMAKLSHQSFVEQFMTSLNVVHLVTGFDFHYGHKGKGSIKTLVEDGKNQFSLSVIEEFQIENEKVSSTKIRELISTGRVDAVKKLLGRFYTTDGIVIHGFKRGRELGFPTANISMIDDYLVPDNGVYVVCVEIFQERFYGMCNVGYNPTFSANNNKSIEVHILDFNKDIYNEKLSITWLKKIRDEMKFNGPKALVEQLNKDQAMVRDYMESMNC
jgi:riboflavin kinase / FMN adenylyltransferase